MASQPAAPMPSGATDAGEIAPAAAVPPGRGQAVVRRVIVFSILFALVVTAAIGLSGLLERAIAAVGLIVADDAGLARSLAFTLIAAPLAGLLWWWERRRLADPAERASLLWTAYLTAMSLTALVVTVVALGTAATAGIDGQWRPGDLATGIVWAAVWVWHRQMRRSAATAPTRLPDLPVQLGAVYGLGWAASGAISAIAVLVAQALVDVSRVLVQSQHWPVAVLQAAVWCALGVLAWWWQWFRERAKDAPGTFAVVLLVLVVGAAAATALFAVGSVLFALLRLLFAGGTAAEAVSDLDVAIAAALIGAIVWVYHAGVLAHRSVRARRAARLVVSAIALIGAASGFGVVVNALLATFATAVVDSDPRTLLLGGVSAILVGAPVWWLAWRPRRAVSADEAGDAGRRVYLVAIFGVSAIVAIVTVLVIGYRLFEFGLDGAGSGGLIERLRAPLGLLCATAVVFGYHFAIWRHDAALAGTVSRPQAIGRLVLVAGGDAHAIAGILHAQIGAPVTVWRAADDDARLAEDDLPALVEQLRAVSAPRVLVLAAADGGARIVPLAD